MYARLRTRFLIILLVTLSSIGLFLYYGINLGLDLKGGEHLVLEVVTDDAVRGETDHVIQSLGSNMGTRIAINEFTVASDDARTKANQLPDWFHRVFITLVDTHLAALISAAFLFIFGTGAIRGFAVTLVIGLASNMFTSVFVSRTLFDWTLARAGRREVMSI